VSADTPKYMCRRSLTSVVRTSRKHMGQALRVLGRKMDRWILKHVGKPLTSTTASLGDHHGLE
jgi:hypothetical protein